MPTARAAGGTWIDQYLRQAMARTPFIRTLARTRRLLWVAADQVSEEGG